MSLSTATDSTFAAPQQAGKTWLILVVSLWLGTVFFAASHRFDFSTLETYQNTAEEREEAVAEGSVSRRLAYPTIGLLGILLLMKRGDRRLELGKLATWAIAVFCVYCLFSLSWSVAPLQTLKRLTITGFCLLGVMGMSRRFSVRDLLWVAMAIAAIYISIGIAVEIQLGTFRPWDFEYRFAGTAHPNMQGSYCALLVFACFFAFLGTRRGRLPLLALMCLGVLMLLLTKSRASCFGAIASLTTAWFFGATAGKRWLFALVAVFTVSLGLLVLLLAGADVAQNFGTAARIGRPAEGIAGALSGRDELWSLVIPHIQDRWLLGHGYEAFWHPANVFEISQELQWTIGSAHSAPLELLLNVGLAGATLFVVAIVATVVPTFVAYRRTGSSELGFVMALVVFGLVSGMVESVFLHPVALESFIAACGLVRIACTRQAETVGSTRDEFARSAAPAAGMSQPLPHPWGVS